MTMLSRIALALMSLGLLCALGSALASRHPINGFHMEPQLQQGQVVLVNLTAYSVTRPQRGDVILYWSSGTPRFEDIKRVIGMPHDTIEIRDRQFRVNGQALQGRTGRLVSDFKMEPTTLADKEYFVLGDNYDESSPMSYPNSLIPFGTVTEDMIRGRAWFRISPLAVLGVIR